MSGSLPNACACDGAAVGIMVNGFGKPIGITIHWPAPMLEARA